LPPLPQLYPERAEETGYRKDLSAESREMLEHLREANLKCRAAPRANLFEACALLAYDHHDVRVSHANIMMRCLKEALGRRPRILRPGTQELSFDEAWLVELISAAGRSDEQSFAFLLRSRVEQHARRSITFLAARIAEQFSLI